MGQWCLRKKSNAFFSLSLQLEMLASNCGKMVLKRMSRVGQNRIYTPYMTAYSVISLPKILYIHRIYMVLANPKNEQYVSHVLYTTACYPCSWRCWFVAVGKWCCSTSCCLACVRKAGGGNLAICEDGLCGVLGACLSQCYRFEMVLLHKLLPRLRKESMKWVLCQIVFAFVKVACVGNWVHVCRNLINFKQ